MRRPRYLGRGQIAICQRSGEKIYASELVRDGRLTSLLVSPEWADPAQPQERPYVPEDLEGTAKFPISPENPKPVVAPVLSAEALPSETDPVVTLTWTPAYRIAGPRIEEYDILRDSGDGFELIDTVVVEYNFIGAILGPGLEYLDEDVVTLQTYAYKVIALTSDNRGLTSNIVEVTIPETVTAPVLSGAIVGDDAHLTWTAATGGTVSTYRLYRSIAGAGDFTLIFSGAALVYDDPISMGDDFDYFVAAVIAGHEFDSNTVNIDAPVVSPTAPVLSGTFDTPDIDLSWTAATSSPYAITSYVLYRSVDGGGYGMLTTTGGATLAYTDTDVDRFQHRYDYKVVAINQLGGVSPDSNIVTFTQIVMRFVAGRNVEGSTNGYMTSEDGITWTLRSNPSMGAVKGICHAPELNLFVAVGFEVGAGGGAVQTSPDGITWTDRTPAADSHWNDVCWSPEEGLFVAVSVDGGASSVMTSPDGTTWTSRTTPDKTWNCVRWLASAGLFAAGGSPGALNTDGVMTSPDGITWTLRTVPLVGSFGFNSSRMSVSDDYFICSNRGEVVLMKSSDGITWALIGQSTGTGHTNVAFGAGTLVATTATTHFDYSLDDGTGWTQTALLADGAEAVIYAPELDRWVAVGPATSDQGASYSPDGIDWVVAATPGNTWFSVCFGLVVTA